MRLASFIGGWSIARRIDDRRTGGQGLFTGAAEFRSGPEGVSYHEDGILTLGTAAPMRGTRDYVWREAGGAIEVWFADGRFFHRFVPDGGEARAEHDCAPDHYAVRYDFQAWPLWRSVWRVTGPRKDYEMVSDFSPAGQGG